MKFSASKSRTASAKERIGRGSPIIPSAAIQAWYYKKIMEVTASMIEDYRSSIKDALEDKSVKKLFAEDAAASEKLSSTLSRLKSRWKNVFEGFATKSAEEFVKKCETQATATTMFSLSTAGIKQPVAEYTSNVANILGAAKTYNHTLITNIQVEVHEKVFSSVMLSLTSPNPEQQGMQGILNELNKIGGFSKDRARLIARDQTSKLYSSLSDARMEENGVEEFEWLHSSAGKTYRHSHVEKDGMVFKLNDPRLWEGPKSDQGPPGWAINCRCRKVPII